MPGTAPHMTLDPGRGYVALPLDILDLDLSPGAFRALVEFCRMADRDGWCWPSLAQLSERMGRSRAAISGYVAELREVGVLETLQQRTANGFNARLKFRVTFWQAWRSRFSSGQKAERRVNPAERSIEDTNHSHQNHDSAPAAPVAEVVRKPCDDFGDLIAAWRRTVGDAPYPTLRRMPEPDLLRRTRAALTGPDRQEDIAGTLRALYDERKVKIAPPDLLSQSAALTGVSARGLRIAFRAIWQPHWRRPPLPRQLDAIAAAARQADPGAGAAQLLRSYLRRHDLARKRLQPSPRCRTFNETTAD